MTAGGRPRRATLQTVADHVGVSRTTVSNAYNRPDQLGPELRQRILDAAAELGYAGPAAAARMLRTGRTGALGLVFTEDLRTIFADPNTALLLEGIAESSALSRTALTLLPADDESDAGPIHHAAVDGLVVFSVPAGHPVLRTVAALDVPTVIVDQPDLGDSTSFVGIDDRRGAREAGTHLVELGHRRIGVLLGDDRSTAVAGPIDDPDTTDLARIARERLAGYRDAAEATDDEVTLVVWNADGLDPDAGRRAATALLDTHPELTAVACLTDLLAIGAAQAAQRLGRSVPEDLSLVGFDDIPRAATWDPPLTTVHQPLVDKGRAAAELLLGLIEDGRPRRVELPIGLVVRDSTAPAPPRRG